MLYLPKGRERYYAALRLYIQNQILKQGQSKKLMMNLKKITLAELLSRPARPEPVDISELSDALLGSCLLTVLRHKKYLSTRLVGGGTYIADPKLISALLLELVATGFEERHCEINVHCEDTGICFSATGKGRTGQLVPLVKKLGAALYRDSNGKFAVINIPAKKTDLLPNANPREWDYVADPLSSLHVFLSDINA